MAWLVKVIHSLRLLRSPSAAAAILWHRYTDSSLVSLASTVTGRYVIEFAPSDLKPLDVRLVLDEAESDNAHVSLFAVATNRLRPTAVRSGNSSVPSDTATVQYM